METNDQKLKKIQDELMNEIDKESKIESHIKDSSKEIAAQLLLSKKVAAEINDTPYQFGYRVFDKAEKKMIYMLIANITKREITPEKYVPFTATVEVDTNYSMQENLQAAVEAFIRHVSGKTKAEILE